MQTVPKFSLIRFTGITIVQMNSLPLTVHPYIPHMLAYDHVIFPSLCHMQILKPLSYSKWTRAAPLADAPRMSPLLFYAIAVAALMLTID
jgi:hypothetical protein